MSTRARWAFAALFMLALTACSGGDATDTSAAVAPTTTTGVPTTTMPPATTTSLPTTTTTDDGVVGDPEALQASFEELERLIAADITYDEPVPIPDLTNPDPVVALAEAFRFEVWLMEHGPHSSWAALYNIPGSPREGSVASDLGLWGLTETRFPGIVDTYQFVAGDVVPIDQTHLSGGAPHHPAGRKCRCCVPRSRRALPGDQLNGRCARRGRALGRNRGSPSLPDSHRLDAVQRGA